MARQPSFQRTNAEDDLIQHIADRTLVMMRLHRSLRDIRPRQDVVMDIAATHASGNRLRLADLLAADDFNFAHDVFGIERHLNRNTGALEGFFRPRFSAREKVAS